MNGATLVTALQHTLNPDRATRVQAEGALAQVRRPAPPRPPRPRRCRRSALRQVHGCAGFLAELLKIAAADGARRQPPPRPPRPSAPLTRGRGAALDAGVRQASSIYFKNLVRREWSTLAGDSERPQLFSDGARPRGPPAPRLAQGAVRALPTEEKALVRDNLLETLIMAPPLVRCARPNNRPASHSGGTLTEQVRRSAQMGLALTTIAYSDFPDRWPGCVALRWGGRSCSPNRVRKLHRLFPGIMANMRSGDENRTMGSLIAMRLLAKRFE